MANEKKIKIVGTTTFADNISAPNYSGTNTGDVTLTTVGSSPNSNGLSLSGQQLRLQPADGSNPGAITAGTQTIGGAKTFSSPLVVSDQSSSTGHTSNAIQSDGGISARRGIFTGNATSGQGGQLFYRLDTGSVKWMAGLDGTASAVNYIIYDWTNARADLTINASTGNATFFGSVTATSFIGDIDGGSF